jgi:hypothetical protein
MPQSHDAPVSEPDTSRSDRLPRAACPGRSWALGAGTIAALGGLADLAFWLHTTQQGCSDGFVQFFDFVAIGRGVAIAVVVLAAIGVAAAWRKAPHRLLAAFAILLVAVDVLVAVSAAVVGAGKVTSCFTF